MYDTDVYASLEIDGKKIDRFENIGVPDEETSKTEHKGGGAVTTVFAEPHYTAFTFDYIVPKTGVVNFAGMKDVTIALRTTGGVVISYVGTHTKTSTNKTSTDVGLVRSVEFGISSKLEG